MTLSKVIASAFLLTFSLPLAAQAQGIPGGAAHGAYVGERTAGPVGAVVGGAVGGVIGGIEGVLGTDRRYYDGSRVYVDGAPYAARPHRFKRSRHSHRMKRHRGARYSHVSRASRYR